MMVLPDPITQLQIAYSVQDVAYALRLDPKKFFYVVQRCDDGSYYRTFNIPKKSGGERTISQPVRGLGLAQTRLADVLTQHYRVKSHVKGYVKGTSFVDNAQYHEKQRWILNLDIEDFFPTITFGRVRGLFLSSVFNFNPRVATILARISTYQGCLPQGARTSPIIANFIANNLDKALLRIAKDNRLRYSRYADDITLSSSNRRIPHAIVKDMSRKYSEGQIEVGAGIVDAFARSGFNINPRKTRLLLRSDRQEVTGLVVNEGTNVWRRDVERIRMKLHSAKKFGLPAAAQIWVGKPESDAFISHIVGWLAFIRQVRGSADPVLAKLCKQAFEAGISAPTWIEEYAGMVKEFDVFLSHASEDKPTVRKLRDRLEKEGVTVFFDEDSISWGDSIVEKINIGLLRSRFFMPFLTDTFAAKGWTNKELNSAISNSASQKGRILPIKSADFEIDAEYPLLNDTLYKVWPSAIADEDEFLNNIVDEVIAMVEKQKMPPKI